MCIIKADVKSWQIIAYRKRVPDMRKKWIRLIAAAVGSFLLAGCGADTQIDDYATNANFLHLPLLYTFFILSSINL